MAEKIQIRCFYIIGQDDTTGGLFWLVNKAVMHIAYAIEKGTYFSADVRGAKAVLLMNGRFKYKKIYNSGFYQ